MARIGGLIVRWRPLFPERITVRPYDPTRTVYDPDRGEPARMVARSGAVTLIGEVDERRRSDGRDTSRGVTLDDTVELRVAVKALERSGWTPKRHDRIVEVANPDGSDARSVSWYVVEHHRITKERRRSKTVSIRCSRSPLDDQTETSS